MAFKQKQRRTWTTKPIERHTNKKHKWHSTKNCAEIFKQKTRARYLKQKKNVKKKIKQKPLGDIQMKITAIEIRRSSNVGIGYAYELKHIKDYFDNI